MHPVKLMLGMISILITAVLIITLWVVFVGLTIDGLWRGVIGIIGTVLLVVLCLQSWVWMGITTWDGPIEEEP